MTAVIRHPRKPTPTAKIDDIEYMADHFIDVNSRRVLERLGGVNGQIRIPILVVDHTILPGSTSSVIDGLDGNAHREYIVNYDLMMVPGAFERVIHLLPNNSSAGCRYVSHLSGHTGTTTLHSVELNRAGALFGIIRSAWAGDLHVMGTGRIDLATGRARTGRFDSTLILTHEANNGLRFSTLSTWTDTTTNLTSLGIAVSGGNFGGRFQIWREIKVNLSH